jgi:hypothetical protein
MSSLGGSLTNGESMGGGWEDRGLLEWPIDGEIVGGKVDDGGCSDQWLPERNFGLVHSSG